LKPSNSKEVFEENTQQKKLKGILSNHNKTDMAPAVLRVGSGNKEVSNKRFNVAYNKNMKTLDLGLKDNGK
jgi:hypothetical protein